MNSNTHTEKIYIYLSTHKKKKIKIKLKINKFERFRDFTRNERDFIIISERRSCEAEWVLGRVRKFDF